MGKIRVKRKRSNRKGEAGNRLFEELIYFAAGAAVGSIGLVGASRWLFQEMVHRATRIIMTDVYDENLWELVSAASRVGVNNIAEANMRSEKGTVIQRPLGSPKKVPNFTNLMFDMAQLDTLPTPQNTPVDMRVTIGPRAAKPLIIDMPIMIAGMAYGWALSEQAKIGLALGAKGAGTASNTGQGPFLESERQAAGKLIFQYHRGTWTKDPKYFRRCDAIEIQMGQGASAGIGLIFEPKYIDEHLQRQFGVAPGEPAISHARHAEVHKPADLGKLVSRLREQSEGLPIGVKMGAGKRLERDLEVAIQADVDYIALDGGQAAAKGSPPILEDDFGLPTIFALVRAVRYLEEQKARGSVSLIISGGLNTPGDFLKALALGADAVNIGAIALFAMTHKQVMNAIPYEPPTQAVWYNGKGAAAFDAKAGGKALANFLKSCAEEIAEGVRALGKTSVHEIGTEHLFALDRLTAEICGVPLGYEPYEIPPLSR